MKKLPVGRRLVGGYLSRFAELSEPFLKFSNTTSEAHDVLLLAVKLFIEVVEGFLLKSR
ncbi:MAG TPA: hypothetical protein VLL07_06870 [Pontiella sp.]|nr:hypothetical protein [Pontiella sp.]